MFEISSIGLARETLGRLVIPFSGGSALYSGTPTAMEQRACKLSSKMDSMKVFLVTRKASVHAPVSRVKCEYRKQNKTWLAQSVEAPATSFQVYGNVHELPRDAAIVNSLSTNQNERKGRSRVLAAWKQLQSWSSHSLLSNAQIEDVHRSSHGPRNEAVQPRPPKKIHVNHNMEFPCTPTFVSSAPSANSETGLRRSSNVDASQASQATMPMHNQYVQNRFRSVGTMTAAAPTNLSSLCLEDLALCKANFLVALKSSAETNETSYCAALVQASLATMLQGAKEAEQNANAIDLWLDMAEEQLLGVPSETDVLHLETMLDNINSSFKVKDLFTSNDEQIPLSRSRQLEEIASAVTFLASNLARMPKAGDIGQIRSKIMETKREMARCSRAASEAVLKLRLALMRGEVAWLKTLDVTTARLDSISHAMFP